MKGTCHLALDEVEVHAANDPKQNIALRKPADQKSVSRHSVSGTAGHPTSADGGFLLAHTREVVGRGLQLAARLRAKSGPARLDVLAIELKRLERRLAELERTDAVDHDSRRDVYFDARRLTRAIAL